MNIIEFLRAIDGQAQLWTNDGQFLGLLSSNQYDPNSIYNPNGTYGNSYSLTSIRNPSSLCGSTWGIYSPYNPNSLCPPAIVYQGQVIGVVTKNRHFCTNGVPTIDPDLLFATYSSNNYVAPNPLGAYTRMHRDTQNFVASLSPSFGLGLPMDQP